jgi:hypothetical protein
VRSTSAASLGIDPAVPPGYDNVEAPDERAAEAAAVAQFSLDEEQCRRLVVREED